MRALTIYRRYFTASDCYKSGTKQKSIAIQVHSTGANNPRLCRYVGPDDGRLGKNRYNNHSNRAGSNVCASAYIGQLADGSVAVYQSLPWDMRCWLSGSGKNGNANRMGYIGFEICEDGLNNEAYFREAVMTASVNLTAYLCALFGTTPRTVVKSFTQGDALTVMDHQELHSRLLASNHGDIRHWLSKYGLTMEDYRDAVEAALQEGVEVTYIDCDTGTTTAETIDPAPKPERETEEIPMYQATVTCTGAYLNLRAEPDTGATRVDKLNRGETVNVLDDSNADWWKVEHNGKTGYAITHNGADVYLTAQSVETGDNATQTEDEAAVQEKETEPVADTVMVDRQELKAIYNIIGGMLGEEIVV